MASPVGAILFLLPFTLPISHFHFPLPFTTSIYHFHLPLPRLLPSARYPMAATLWLRVCTSSGQCHSCTRFLSCQNRFPMALRCNAPASNSSDIANLSAHLHRLPTPPPYLRRMRLLHGRGAGVGCKMRLSPARAQVLDGK